MAKTMIFKNNNLYWLYLIIDPESKPLSRSFFRLDHFGGSVFNKLEIKIEKIISIGEIDKQLTDMANDEEVLALN